MRRYMTLTADQKEIGGIVIGAMVLVVTFVVWNVFII